MYASNRLYSGEVESPREAMQLFERALRDEARAQRLLDAQLEDGSDLADRLTNDAAIVKMLVAGMGYGSTELFQRWATSADKLIHECGEVCLSGDFSQFSI